MKAVELAKNYDPSSFEMDIYKKWTDAGLFSTRRNKGKENFVIVMPPPNVTGILHMGHALNNTLPDILIRYNKMIGKDALWVPGTDHAGIATQHVVEKKLAKEGLRRVDLGREEFLKRTWQLKDEHHEVITRQLKTMGSCCDWDRERFTLDEGLSKAVRECFVTLYEKDLIYKGQYLVNYCPHCQTALSDDEVEHHNVDGKLYDIRYPYADRDGYITVATTRPETMFGDVAVAVNPSDERYKDLLGELICLPLTDKKIPIIADSYVDMEFGTGMVKITPAHDPNDWKIGQRHNLEIINILNPDGTLNEKVPSQFQNLDAKVARDLVAKQLEEEGYLIGTTPLPHEVGHCYRCNTVIEPYVSKQWFVKMEDMAEKALKAWKDGEVNFHPKRWENTYENWLTNIRDWCISRQLWWGHRIPVWYCDDCNAMTVKREDPSCCDSCGSKNIHQEEDVLDTWFSSWLWPFSILGWPEKTPDFKNFFKTTTLVTGYDILFFWVARMIMASLEFTGEVPFKDVYLTGLVRDKQGRKMSKSLGNGIDPLEVINKYGSDAMKFTLSYMSTQGQDILIDKEDFKFGSKFSNKIWNATRFLLMNLEGRNLVPVEEIKKREVDLWIYHKLGLAAKSVGENLQAYKFGDASNAVYDFFWNDFCDWYIEIVKSDLRDAEDKVKDERVSLLMDLLEKSMRLMHPLLPFVTEEIYSKLPNTKGFVIEQSYPEFKNTKKGKQALENFELLQAIIKSVRTNRAELGISQDMKMKLVLRLDNKENYDFIGEYCKYIEVFAKLSELVLDKKSNQKISKYLPFGSIGYSCFLDVGSAIDVDAEISKLTINISKAEKDLSRTNSKLNNDKFVNNAKQEAIDKEKAKKVEFETVISKAKDNIELLKALK